MAKIDFLRKGLVMHAEGSEEFAAQQAAAYLAYIGRETVNDGRTGAPRQLTEAETLPDGSQHDVVAIYDNAGIPSIMHRFRRFTDKELFGGSEKVHPAFIIGGEVYDEIFISVYQNTMINGRPYSLPMAEPVYNISADDFAEACFSKGEGWHCITAVEWGLLANISLALGTLPHGNTDCGKWHGDSAEKGMLIGNGPKTLTGSGPATWTHDHTETGVHDLCGNLWEHCRGMRIIDGRLQAARNNDAALPETDLSENGGGWHAILDDAGRPLSVSVGGGITITPEQEIKQDYNGCCWADVKIESESEQLKELAFYAGEPDAYCYMDSTEGEYILYRGGRWGSGGHAGVFHSHAPRWPGECRHERWGPFRFLQETPYTGHRNTVRRAAARRGGGLTHEATEVCEARKAVRDMLYLPPAGRRRLAGDEYGHLPGSRDAGNNRQRIYGRRAGL